MREKDELMKVMSALGHLTMRFLDHVDNLHSCVVLNVMTFLGVQFHFMMVNSSFKLLICYLCFTVTFLQFLNFLNLIIVDYRWAIDSILVPLQP